LSKKPIPRESDDPADTWKHGWKIERRMLEARKHLRGTKLWKSFSLQRDFEAFSVHELAKGVEEALGKAGVISSFTTASWQKQGNLTVVVGTYQVMSVDDRKDFLAYETIGEAIDNGDKGIGKAVSYARKNGMVSALNLGIGTDNEESDEKAQPYAGPTMSGTTKAPPPKDASNNVPPQPEPATSAQLPNQFAVRFADGTSRIVNAESFVQQVHVIFENALSIEQLDEFCKINKTSFEAFGIERPEDGQSLQGHYQRRKNKLTRRSAA
jgi:hypothetical protein